MEILDFNMSAAQDFTVEEVAPSQTPLASGVLAAKILKKVLQYRRLHPSQQICGPACPSCQAPHLEKVLGAIRTRAAVTFVLPAFPGKSPNSAKVLGPLPDMGEQLALRFLQKLCDEIEELYAPGARIVLCSDGRVFSDVVGMREQDVTDYQDELDRMIAELGLKNLSTFNLDELGSTHDFDRMRADLMGRYGTPVEVLRDKVLRGAKPHARAEDEEAHRMYLGITRFLVEDSSFPGQPKSRTAIQKECKVKSYEVIRRSNAWSELIAERFPEAIRLSIHPQTCGGKKLGIRLVGSESWMTPWHGVAVKLDDEFVLLKRHEAEARGARLVLSARGRPSHFELRGAASVGLFSEVTT